MDLDRATVEHLVERITKEVLILLREEEASAQSASECLDCNDQCTDKCPDKTQEVVNAGASRIANPLGSTRVAANVAHMIDHTLLKADASQEQIAQLCYEARKHGFAAVCVNPTNVKLAAQLLKDSPVAVCAVIGFPLGATSP